MSTVSKPKKHHRDRAPEASPEAVGAEATNPGSNDNGSNDKGSTVSQERQHRIASGIDWVTSGWLVLLHVGAIAAPFYFSWSGLAISLFLHWIAGGVGVCLCYHRLLTHDSFKTYRPIKLFLSWLGGFAGEGSAIDWVANHRKHHAYSDREGDPHSPNDGGFWSHAGWLAYAIRGQEAKDNAQRWAPDLANDAGVRFVANLFLPTHFIVGGVLFALGYAFGDTTLGISWLVWGLFVRLVFVLHSTWFVNSASHMWGYRNYETTDDSRNNWWVALVTYGEGWHNNHHAYPRMAKHGHKWWEIDVTFMTIRLMQFLGLAWDVVDYKNHREKVGG